MSGKNGKARIYIAYQGEPGAYSELAALEFFAEADLKQTAECCGNGAENSFVYIPCASFEDVFEALSIGAVDRAVIPIENSLAGTIHQNLDLLLRYQELHVVGEHDFRVQHCLLALPGSQVSDIKIVRSHFMALAQCSGYLSGNQLVSEVAKDTAGAAKRIRDEQLHGSAAIASKHAASIYGLQILEQGIEDDKNNYTRFLILADSPGTYRADLPAKTSIAFTLVNKPGALFRALSVFAVLDIDLTKVESRHIQTVVDAVSKADIKLAQRWGYVFYVDFSRSYAEEPVQNALKNLQQITPFFRLLGSYRLHVHSSLSS